MGPPAIDAVGLMGAGLSGGGASELPILGGLATASRRAVLSLSVEAIAAGAVQVRDSTRDDGVTELPAPCA